MGNNCSAVLGEEQISSMAEVLHKTSVWAVVHLELRLSAEIKRSYTDVKGGTVKQDPHATESKAEELRIKFKVD